jgi:hypothetical protein
MNTMKATIQITVASLTVASIAIAAATKSPPLTPRRIAELTSPDDAGPPKAYKIEIFGLRRPFPPSFQDSGPTTVILPVEKPQAVLECVREFRFPSTFTPPKAVAGRDPAFEPTWPQEFETVNTGWTIRLSAKQHSKVVALAGVADYVEAEMPAIGTGGYGTLGAPIYSEAGQLLSPNVVNQPKVETTTTRFQIFALPGETYDVTLFRGTKAEKHRVTVTAE